MEAIHERHFIRILIRHYWSQHLYEQYILFIETYKFVNYTGIDLLLVSKTNMAIMEGLKACYLWKLYSIKDSIALYINLQ